MLEYLRGGQFLDHLHTIGNKYSEQQAAALFAQVRHVAAEGSRMIRLLNVIRVSNI